jgi:hypothetical protein
VENYAIKAANAVATSGGFEKHEEKMEHGVHIMKVKYLPYNLILRLICQGSYIFSLSAAHVFWSKSSKTPSEKRCKASASAGTIPTVATATSCSALKWVH